MSDRAPAAASAIYTGRVRHRRFRPRPHRFTYRTALLYLDLDELPGLFAGRWLWGHERRAAAAFRRTDYLGDPHLPLDEAVRALVADRTGTRPAGPIRLLTHLRYFGYCFNPVSFYYCFDRGGRGLDAIVAEITNTPWNERHAYVLGAAANLGSAGTHRYRFGKSFHVSPFMPMQHEYDWRLSVPGDRLAVHMANRAGGERQFDATLTLARRPITTAQLLRVLLRHPTARTIAAIYLQAARLWLKRTPFVPHP